MLGFAARPGGPRRRTHTAGSLPDVAERDESTPADSAEHEHRTVPRLPQQLVDPRPIVLIGTALWVAGVVYFGLIGWVDGEFGMPFWTCLVGAVLGGLGYAIFRWQLAAAHRGSRGAWQGLTGLDD